MIIWIYYKTKDTMNMQAEHASAPQSTVYDPWSSSSMSARGRALSCSRHVQNKRCLLESKSPLEPPQTCFWRWHLHWRVTTSAPTAVRFSFMDAHNSELLFLSAAMSLISVSDCSTSKNPETTAPKDIFEISGWLVACQQISTPFWHNTAQRSLKIFIWFRRIQGTVGHIWLPN